MKRDMEYVRKLLIDFSEGKGKGDFKTFTFESDKEAISQNLKYEYHLKIMEQAGLITYKKRSYKSGFALLNAPELTWYGQDYLSAIESDTVWEKIKVTIKEKGLETGQVSFEVFKELAKAKMKETFGLI